MKNFSIGVGDENDFFAEGRKLAALADGGRPLPEETVVTFGDPNDLLKTLTPARLRLLRMVKAHPDSIQGLARRVHRDRSAVRRDLEHLIEFGIVQVESRILPGHGRMKVVGMPARRVLLHAEI